MRIRAVPSSDFVGEQPGRWRVYAVDARGDAGLPSPWRYFRFTV